MPGIDESGIWGYLFPQPIQVTSSEERCHAGFCQKDDPT